MNRISVAATQSRNRLPSPVCSPTSAGSGGTWYQASWGENSPQARHCVSGQQKVQLGHTLRVQKVFQRVPHSGLQTQRSRKPGFHRQLGQ